MQTLENGTGAAFSPALIGSIDVPGIAEDVDVYGEDDEPFDMDAFSPEELAELEAWRRAELRLIDKEAADARRGMRENILAEYGTPENYYHAVGCSGDEVEIARIFNLSGTFMEPKNCRRRESGRAVKARVETQKHRMLAFNAPVVKPAFLSAATPTKESKKEAPDAKATVRAFYAAAIDQHPAKAAKLGRSLEFQLGEYENTVSHFTAKGKTESEAVALWENRARMAMEAKTR